jgi:hypothetical protein
VRLPWATRHLTEDGPGLDFLGFHHRWVRAQGRTGTGKGVAFLARWPTRNGSCQVQLGRFVPTGLVAVDRQAG